MTDNNDAQPAKELQELMGKIEEGRAAAARDPRFRQFPESYPARCQEWAQRDFWTLQEAANLLGGCDPQRPSHLEGHGALNAHVARIRELLTRSSVRTEGTLKKRYYGTDVVAWAQKKHLEVPSALLKAMGYTAREDKPVHGNAVRNAEKRESVLGAAIYALVHYRAQCTDRGGKVTGTQVATVLEQNAPQIFHGHAAPFAVSTMARHINKYLRDKSSE